MTTGHRVAVLAAVLLTAADTAPAQDMKLLERDSLKKSLDTIGQYYERVREKLGGSDATQDPPAAPPAPVTVEVAPSPAPTPLGGLVLPPPLPGDADRSALARRPGYRDGVRNPFAPTRDILSTAARTSGSDAYRFRALAEPTAIPRMRLRGLINEGDENVAALLEIENSGTYIVREGDTVGLYELGSNAVIRVRKINRLDLVVEAGSLGQVLIIR